MLPNFHKALQRQHTASRSFCVRTHASRLFGFTCFRVTLVSTLDMQASQDDPQRTRFQCLLEQTQVTAPRSTRAQVVNSVPRLGCAQPVTPTPREFRHRRVQRTQLRAEQWLDKLPGFYCCAMRNNKPTSPERRTACGKLILTAAARTRAFATLGATQPALIVDKLPGYRWYQFPRKITAPTLEA